MTPEAQRIAIAEACGWKRDNLDRWRSPTGHYYENQSPPDYLNDLDAMHEAEKQFGDFGTVIWRTYQNHIADGDIAILAGKLCHSTAARRAEAFLRTLGLWKE